MSNNNQNPETIAAQGGQSANHCYTFNGKYGRKYPLRVCSQMQKDLNVPDEYVIIKRNLFEALLYHHGMTFEI